MCTTSVSMAEINQRLDSPQDYYSSPSSIAEVDKYNCSQAEEEKHDHQAVEQLSSPSQPGDDALNAQDDRSDLVKASDTDGINVDVALEIGSPPSRKRRHSDLVNEDVKEHQESVSADNNREPPSRTPATLDFIEAGSHPLDGSVDRNSDSTSAEKRADIDYANDGDDLECSPVLSTRFSRRTLYIEYWSRTDECKERKWDHLDDIAEKYGAAEDHIFDTTLRGRTACLEPNMFPYDTPAGIEHWTLWHVKELNHEQIKQYVENWIDANAPHVVRWNYDDNPERSIDIFHVHVYLQVADGTSVLQGRKFEDLVHEMD
ncbi:hypothetical protein FI667_g2503, partial [Globisporangium splendens]